MKYTTATIFCFPVFLLSCFPALADDSIRQAAAKIAPSLVRVESYGGSPRELSIIGSNGPTTGVLYSSDGYILTSTFNFLRKPPVITVTLSDGSRHVAQLLGRDELRKICILKIDNVSDLPTPTWLAMNDARVGQSAISLGFGYGPTQPALSTGIVSALYRANAVAIQTDANTSPANYGGPLIDLHGRALGIIVPLQPFPQSPPGESPPGSGGEGAEWYDSGVGFAIPIADIQPLIQRLKKNETLTRGIMGIRLDEIHTADPPGVSVIAVAPDSSAQKSDLRPNDVITHINSQPTANVHELRRTMAHHPASDEITLTIRRADQSLEISLTLTPSPSPEQPPPTPTDAPPTQDAE